MANYFRTGILSIFLIFGVSCGKERQIRNGMESYKESHGSYSCRAIYKPIADEMIGYHDFHVLDGKPDEQIDMFCDEKFRCTQVLDNPIKFDMFIPEGTEIVLRNSQRANELQKEYDKIKVAFEGMEK